MPNDITESRFDVVFYHTQITACYTAANGYISTQ